MDVRQDGRSLERLLKFWLAVTILLLVYCTKTSAVQTHYLVMVTRASGLTTDTTYIQLIGPNGTTEEMPLLNSRVAATTHRTFFYVFRMKDVGTVCTVKLRLSGFDGWRVGKAIVVELKTFNLRQFLFDEEINDMATLTRNISRNGTWSNWGDWGKCDAKCGQNGVVRRHRVCYNPEPICGGSLCTGASDEIRPCAGAPCPTGAQCLPCTTSPPTTVAAPCTTPSPSVSAAADRKVPLIGMGVILALSIVLNIIVVMFLIVVIRNQWKLKSRSAANFSDISTRKRGSPSHNTYMNEGIACD